MLTQPLVYTKDNQIETEEHLKQIADQKDRLKNVQNIMTFEANECMNQFKLETGDSTETGMSVFRVNRSSENGGLLFWSFLNFALIFQNFVSAYKSYRLVLPYRRRSKRATLIYAS